RHARGDGDAPGGTRALGLRAAARAGCCTAVSRAARRPRRPRSLAAPRRAPAATGSPGSGRETRLGVGGDRAAGARRRAPARGHGLALGPDASGVRDRSHDGERHVLRARPLRPGQRARAGAGRCDRAGRAPLEALAEARATFAALPRTRLWDSAPGTALVREFSPPGDDPSTLRLGLFRTTPAVAGAPRDNVYAFPSERLNKLDFADVGNEASEREHSYTVVEGRETIRRTSKVTEARVVVEEGRVWANAEAVSLRAEPGRDLLVARRFDGFAPGGFRVTVDGQPAGEWWPRAGAYALAEDSFRIPGRLIRSQRVVVRLELIPDSAPKTATFAYWSFSDQ